MLIKREGEGRQCPKMNKQIKVDNGGCLYKYHINTYSYTETLVAKKIIIKE